MRKYESPVTVAPLDEGSFRTENRPVPDRKWQSAVQAALRDAGPGLDAFCGGRTGCDTFPAQGAAASCCYTPYS